MVDSIFLDHFVSSVSLFFHNRSRFFWSTSRYYNHNPCIFTDDAFWKHACSYHFNLFRRNNKKILGSTVFCHHLQLTSGVTTRGAVRQLPQGAWRRGAKLSGRIIFFALQLNFEREISKRSKLNDNDKSNDNR